MKNSLPQAACSLLVLAALAVSVPSAQVPPLTIGGFEKISEARITRSISEFTYRATLFNAGADISGATATATSGSPATTIIDGELTFASVASGSSALSSDTFTFRHDRTVPFDWTSLGFVVTLSDDDLPRVGVTVDDAAAAEAGLDPGTLSVTRTGPTTVDLVVFFTMKGTATEGQDYAALAGSVIIPAGAASTLVTIQPLDDGLFEGPERAILELTPDAAYTIGLSQAAVTITDNELAGVSVVATDDVASEEGPAPGDFTISRTGPTDAALMVFYDVAGAATNGIDYELLSGSVIIPAGSSTAVISVNPIDDALFEDTEGVIIILTPAPGYVVVAPGIAGMVIHDNDGAVVTIEATDPVASEAGDTGTFTVRRAGGDLTQALLVIVARSGTARNGSDYASLGGASFVVTIPAHELTAAVSVVPIADTVVEGDETVTLTISPRAVYTIGAPGQATVTIIGP